MQILHFYFIVHNPDWKQIELDFSARDFKKEKAVGESLFSFLSLFHIRQTGATVENRREREAHSTLQSSSIRARSSFFLQNHLIQKG